MCTNNIIYMCYIRDSPNKYKNDILSIKKTRSNALFFTPSFSTKRQQYVRVCLSFTVINPSCLSYKHSSPSEWPHAIPALLRQTRCLRIVEVFSHRERATPYTYLLCYFIIYMLYVCILILFIIICDSAAVVPV